jgi:hypothetical protein
MHLLVKNRLAVELTYNKHHWFVTRSNSPRTQRRLFLTTSASGSFRAWGQAAPAALLLDIDKGMSHQVAHIASIQALWLAGLVPSGSIVGIIAEDMPLFK